MTYREEHQRALRQVCGEARGGSERRRLLWDRGLQLKLVEAWNAELRGHFGLGERNEPVVRWLETGAPLGANEEISTCGVFPLKPKEDEGPGEEAIAVSSWGEMKSYKSFSDNLDYCTVEMDRLVEKGYRSSRFSRQSTTSRAQWFRSWG